MNKSPLYNATETLTLKTQQDCHQVVCGLIKKANKNVSLFSRCLHPQIYNTAEFIAEIRQFSLRNPFVRTRIMITEVAEVIARGGSLLIDLAGSLSSFITIKRTARRFGHLRGDILIVDDMGFMYRKEDERYEGLANFNDRRESRLRQGQFDTMWEVAKFDPALRRMRL